MADVLNAYTADAEIHTGWRWVPISEYTCGIIQESLSNETILARLYPYLEAERIQEMPGEPEGIWHVKQYRLSRPALLVELQAMAGAIKHGWYIHAFNQEAGILYVVLPGRCFRLPVVKDQSWEEMIEYGLSVGVERRWTERISLRV